MGAVCSDDLPRGVKIGCIINGGKSHFVHDHPDFICQQECDRGGCAEDDGKALEGGGEPSPPLTSMKRRSRSGKLEVDKGEIGISGGGPTIGPTEDVCDAVTPEDPNVAQTRMMRLCDRVWLSKGEHGALRRPCAECNVRERIPKKQVRELAEEQERSLAEEARAASSIRSFSHN